MSVFYPKNTIKCFKRWITFEWWAIFWMCPSPIKLGSFPTGTTTCCLRAETAKTSLGIHLKSNMPLASYKSFIVCSNIGWFITIRCAYNKYFIAYAVKTRPYVPSINYFIEPLVPRAILEAYVQACRRSKINPCPKVERQIGVLYSLHEVIHSLYTHFSVLP